MKKRSIVMIAAAMALGSLTGGGQAMQPVAQSGQAQHAQASEIKGTEQRTRKQRGISINNYGGLDFPPMLSSFGMSPKEYGLRFGSGKSRVGKSNRLAYTHKAKLKRRKG